MKANTITFGKKISAGEMARRYSEIRKLMKSHSLDLLVISGNSQLNQKGHLRYMTNWSQPLFEEYALFPLSGELIYFSRYAIRAALVKSFCKINDVRFPKYGQQRLGNIPARNLSEIIKTIAPTKIGIVGLESMSAEFYLALKKNLPGFYFEDASKILQKVRMIKSGAEIKLVKRSAKLCDHAFDVFSNSIYPGRREFEVLIDVDSEVKRLGAEDTFYMTGSGKLPIIKFYNMAYRIYKRGDLVVFNIELAGPGGYFTQLIRMLSIGVPNKKIQAAYNVCLEAMHEAAQALKPRVKASTIYQIMKRAIVRKSSKMDMNTGHSQGLDIFEPPLISEFDNTELKPGMIIILHPRVFISSKSHVWVGNTYLITEKEAKCLNKADDELFVM